MLGASARAAIRHKVACTSILGCVALCLAVAAYGGNRLAYHLHMRAAAEYDGAYTAPEAYQQARRRYLINSVIYGVATTAIGFGVLWWRGLPQ